MRSSKLLQRPRASFFEDFLSFIEFSKLTSQGWENIITLDFSGWMIEFCPAFYPLILTRFLIFS